MAAEDQPAPATTGPYATAFDTYYSAGWRGILPLPPRRKKSPPNGYTGNEGVFPSYADLLDWSEGRPDANVALRMPRDVIGLDVDAYDGKVGGQTFTDLVVKHGALPPTWRSTSRDDGVSAIRFYRIPTGLQWPSSFPGIEVVRFAHRYAVVWPSIHPDTGGTYRWIDPAGHAVIGVVPRPDDLPMLPDTWISGLTGGEAERVNAKADLTDEATRAWINAHGQGRPCRAVTTLLGRYVLALNAAGESRHETALKATRALVEMAGEGHQGVATALGQVHSAFVRAIDDDRDRVGEWERMVTGAVRLAAAHHPDPETEDPCEDPMRGLLGPIEPRPIQPPRSDPWTAPSPLPASALVSVDASSPETPAAPSTPTTPTDPDVMAAVRQQLLLEATEKERARREAKRLLDKEETEALAQDNPNRFVTGAAFVLDLPDAVPTVWGTGDDILWAEGEALIIAGGSGVGKSTIASQVVAGMLGIGPGQVLGLDVAPAQGNVLYLAMDRPQQLARALSRVMKAEHRDVLEDRLKVWQGPPPADVAKAPETLLHLAQAAAATVLVVDSLKDAAIGLSDDAVSAGYNRARQMCLAEGIQVLELHHMVKKGANGAKPTSLGDVYGGTWLTAGAGSVILINGDAGDPVVEMRHLKQPMNEVGPYQVIHDHGAGTSEIFHATDLVSMARATGAKGVTAKAAAAALFGSEKPSSAEVQKARRRLMNLTDAGSLALVPGTGTAGTPDAWVALQPDVDTLGGLLVREIEAPSRTFTRPVEGVHAPSRLGGQPSRSEQTRRSGLHAGFETVNGAAEGENGPREALTSDDAENVKGVKVGVNPLHAAPPIGGVLPVKVQRADSGARVVLTRGGHRVDKDTGEIVE